VNVRRIHLSPPHVGSRERELLLDAFDSNWIAPVGPHVDAFEIELARVVGTRSAAALSSGTAGLHLALQLVGVGQFDEVVMPTLTFAATANAAVYLGAQPTFVDVSPASWQIDSDLLATYLHDRVRQGQRPAAVVVVDLYGQCADYDKILPICSELEIPVIEDAAESLGATYRGRPAGSFGRAAVVSFNGNKIITTSGGGMLLSDDSALIDRARHLATQARQNAPHYEHLEVGYNYRMSNLLAAVGRGQLATLEEKVAARRQVNLRYRSALQGLPGVEFMPDAGYGIPTWWLTALTIDPLVFGVTNDEIRAELHLHDIEARPVWKPMHLQPVFAESPRVGGVVAEHLFRTGICLPSGSSLGCED
jgi:dTDP-4-amino-4,6-dideoxygalactose transaminase